jgi:hypothetical protein
MSEHEQQQAAVEESKCPCGKAVVAPASGHPRTAEQYAEDYQSRVNAPGIESPNGKPHKSSGAAVAKAHRDPNTGTPEPAAPRGRPLANPTGVGADSPASRVRDGQAATRLAQAIATGDHQLAAQVAAGLPAGHDRQIAEAVVASLSGQNVAGGFTDGAPIQSGDAGASPVYQHCPSVRALDAGRLAVQGAGRGALTGNGWGSGGPVYGRR